MTLAPSFPTPQVYALDNTNRNYRHHLKIKRKPQRTLHFLIFSTSSLSSTLFSCFSFPLTRSNPNVQFRHHHLLSTNGNVVVEGLAVEEEVCPMKRIFILEPPWISSLFLKGWLMQAKQEEEEEVRRKEKEKYNWLRRRQIQVETEAWERMVEEYKELEKEMRRKKLAPNLPHVKPVFLGWFEPFRDAVEAEQYAHGARPKKQQDSIAPHVEALPADKVAVIVMHKMMAMIMESEEGCVQRVHAAIHVGMAVEQEVRIHKFTERKKSSQSKKSEAGAEDSLDNDAGKRRKYLNSLIRKNRLKEVQMVLKKEECSPWCRDTQAKAKVFEEVWHYTK